MTKKCFVNDCGLFIGLVTEPISEKDFFESEFKDGLFKNYLAELNSRLDGKLGLKSNLYIPIAYRIFGEYDLALFSLIDDLEFGLQIFKPANAYCDQSNEFIYNTQIINGLITRSTKVNKLETIARKTFLKKEKRFPFIGITKLKINNGLLIGNGVDLLEEIKDKLEVLRKDRITSSENQLEIIIIDTFCNNELTIICFSNSYSSISNFVIDLRNLQFKDLNNNKTFLNNCLLIKIVDEEIVKSSHLFSETNTIFGYDYNYRLDNKDDFIDIDQSKENVKYSCTWRIKPGHTKQFLESVKTYNIIFNVENSLSKNTNTLYSQHSLDEILQLPTLNRDGQIFKHIKQFKTTILFPIVEDSSDFDEHHPALTTHLKKYIFKRPVLQEIRDTLNKCNVSKPTTERILSMYNNFNNCIIDAVFFISFIELRAYLDYARNNIISFWNEKLTSDMPDSNYDLGKFHVWLNDIIKPFELAYNNRFHQSNKTNVLPNNSLEFNGGIQQLVSLFDSLYKAIILPFGNYSIYSDFVYISGFERVQSTGNVLRMNILHVLHPELFATIVYKEGFNFILDKLILPENEEFDYEKIGITLKKAKKYNKIRSSLKEFLESNKLIYNKIVNVIDENDVDGNYKNFTSIIDKELVFDFFADMAVFSVGFNKNANEFFFWYWSYFSQMTDCYNDESNFNRYLHLRFLIRIYFMKYYSGISAEDISYIKIPDDSMQIDDFCKQLYTILHDNNNIEGESFIKKCEAIILTTLRNEIKDEYTKQHSLWTREVNLFLRFREDQINKQNIYIKEKILNHEVITSYSNDLSESAFAQRFLHSYLSFIYSNNFNDEINKSDASDKSKVMMKFDPKGGIIINNRADRRKYFTYRSVFYKTLWDFNTKVKIKYLNGSISK